MKVGLIQLVAAKGKEDKYINVKPIKITYFKMVYRRYTNFSMENIRQDFESEKIENLQLMLDKKRTLRVEIPRHGDMVNQVYIVLRIPDIFVNIIDATVPGFETFYVLNWIKNLGFQMIETVSLYIGKKLIDTHTGEWLQVWNELNNSEREKM